ncbi:MAG: M23 family metallopeptidase [Defluviitaleaceae bacterium]|nr:M23 family metallopeptidase [Defluviitaleaceae bacterium]
MHSSAKYRSQYRRSYRENSVEGSDVRERFIVQGMICGVALAALLVTALLGLPFTERVRREVTSIILADYTEVLPFGYITEMAERARYYILGVPPSTPLNITPPMPPTQMPQAPEPPAQIPPMAAPQMPNIDEGSVLTYENNANNTFYELGDEERLFIEDIIRRIHEAADAPYEPTIEPNQAEDSPPEYTPYAEEQGIQALAPPVPPGNARISSPFGNRLNPVTGATEFHNGVDLAFAHGTPVVAIQDGVITDIGYNGYSGNYIRYMTADGMLVGYAHLYDTLVEVGDVVRRGDVVALTGNSGLSTGPHLHVTIWNDGITIDPLTVFAMY